jgi:hypothetical protein
MKYSDSSKKQKQLEAIIAGLIIFPISETAISSCHPSYHDHILMDKPPKTTNLSLRAIINM